MSTSDEAKLVELRVNTQDPATEIFLLDGEFQLVTRGIGRLETQQPPGIYKLKVRAGVQAKEQMLVLKDKPVKISVPFLRFPSAVPLQETAKTHEYHMAAAVNESQKIHVSVGHGSSLFVFARDWTPPDRLPESTGHNPAEGLVLRTFDDVLLANFAAQSKVDLANDPFAACRVELDPGAYRLSVTLSSGETFEKTVVASSGWQTQVFLLQRCERREQSGPGHKSPDLARGAVLLSRTLRFEPNDQQDRLAELARQGLVHERHILSNEVRDLLRYKFDNPMLGIFGAHLVLMESNPDFELVGIIVENLRKMIGESHPDVEALALACGKSTQYVFRVPPMLQRSWRIVIKSTVTQPSLVPRDSFVSRIIDRFTSQEPWLIWKTPDSIQASDESESSDLEEALSRFLQPSTHPSGRLRVLANSVDQKVQQFGDISSIIESEREKGLSASLNDLLDQSHREDLVQNLGIPWNQVDDLIQKNLRGRKG
jgi:hypothetical protein